MDLKKTHNRNAMASVREMVEIALLTALTYIAVAFINVPYGNGGVVHLGDSMIFIAAILFGRKHAAIAGAIGMSLFDLFSPYAVWAPYTFVIKAVMGLIAGTIAYSRMSKGNNWVKNVIGFVLAGIWMIAGYYIAEAIITSNIYEPIYSLLGNVIQFGGSFVIAIILGIALKNTKYFS